ncbi:MAG: 2-hydroxychromene-2-carboxylate isomerase [Alcaligenaceae bacterium]|nr:2-hydroxychromene-2-carboxylate isomerase [Alcaligenaceae bacterium]
MTARIDFYFDFSSPYGYFASTRIDDLARDLGGAAHWHPILLGPMFKATGAAPLLETPLKGDYSRHDMLRTAGLEQIPFRIPEPFPIATVAAARIMLYAQSLDAALGIAFAQQALKAYYVDNIHIGEAENVLQIAKAVGLNIDDTREAIASDAIKAQLRSENEAAMARGVFGSPFIFVGDEPFWGFDRLDTIRRFVQRGS